MTACPPHPRHAKPGLSKCRHLAIQPPRRSGPTPRPEIAPTRAWAALPPVGSVVRWLAGLAVLGVASAAGSAQVTYSGPPSGSSDGPAWSRVPGLTQDMLVVLGVGILLLVVLLVWALFLRKRPHSHSHSHSRHHRGIQIEESGESDSDHARHHHRHRRKRRRRDHRMRNPTLAETGGLPPPRSEPHPPPVT
ncbi:MAG TPA: hypothetical protein PKM43_06925 [Verrucomicrobiota bacterium]|nr:hypothetical protein [Verrucomicrobiota bacterium]